jgi:hypothetical protein
MLPTRARHLRAAAVFALLAAGAAAAQPVTVERDTPLYAEARLESAVVAQLKQGTPGEVIAKNGAWLQLKTAAGSGWLFSFNVRFASQAAAAESSTGGGSALGRLFGPRRSVSVTSTIGVRGLDEEDLKQARFDAAQMRLLDQFAASRAQGEAAAEAAGLAPVRLDYFDARRP